MYATALLYNDEECFVFQVNPDMVPDFERAGLQFVGKDESRRRMEVGLEFFLGYCRLTISS
jgi:CTP synthase